VVPAALRQEVLAGIHDGHYGEVKCVLRAKSAVYWPGCDDHIRSMVASCATCQTCITSQSQSVSASSPSYVAGACIPVGVG
jgi:hypothetical protein